MLKPNPQQSNKLHELIRKTFSNWGFSWGGLLDNRNGEWLLFLQLSLITAHLLPSWPSDKSTFSHWSNILVIPGIILFLLGAILALKAFINLGTSLSPLPEPKIDSILKTRGSYKNCRHPLYQSILLSSLGVSLFYRSYLHVLLLLLLAITLKSKAKREEQGLKEIHPYYKDYMSKTIAMVPGIRFLDWRE